MRVPARPIEIVTQRNFQSAQYVLPADEAEKARLDLQHRLLVNVFGGKLVLAPISLQEGDLVLDSGAATGAWMLELAAQYSPSVTFYGIDISSRLFPVEHPEYTRFSINSITDLPADWAGTFAFVHQRLLIAALTTSMWKIAVAEMFRVLTPGGWVELTECDIDWAAGPQSAKLQAIIHALFRDKGLLVDIQIQIPGFLRDAGFIDIHPESRSMNLGRAGEAEVESTENLYNVFVGMKAPILAAGGFGYVASEDALDALLMGAKEEWLNSNDSSVSFITFYARKPIV